MPSSNSNRTLPGGREIIGGKVYGTIFMGPESERETTLDKLYTASQREQWNRQTENEYMERVRARATERVRDLLLQARRRCEALEAEARKQAEQIGHSAEALKAEAARDRERAAEELRQAEATRREAESKRASAHETGLEEGRAQAREELAQAKEELGNATGAVLIGIQEQCAAIFEAWRGDLAALVREVAEKGTGLVIRAERAEVLSALLDQSMRALLDKRSFAVRVNPEDAELVGDILSDARHVNPRVSTWEVVRDPSLEPGSLVVESDSALVDNSRHARFSAVDEVLSHLEIPSGKADAAAAEAVTHTLLQSLRKAGVDVQEEGAEEASPEPAEAAPEAKPAETSATAEAAADTEEALPVAEEEPAAESDVHAAEPDASSVVDVEPVEAALEEDAPADDGKHDLVEASAEAGTAAPSEDIEQVEAKEIPDHAALAGSEASELVDAFLGGSDGEAGHPLPDMVADELLADMGFASEQKN